MTQSSTEMLVVAVLAAIQVMTVYGKCRFPEFLLRSEPWVGDYKDGRVIAYAHPTFIQLRESFDGGAAERFNQECVKRGPDDKFLVRITKDPTRYRCLQFLKRSNKIVQIKKSGFYVRQNMDICNESNMEIDPFPWVQIRDDVDKDSNIKCPFVGGYNLYAFYPLPNNSMVCSNNRLLMRMESECEQGGGIEFNFRNEYCVPKGLPRTPIQKAQCVAHWTQGRYTFIILKHADQDGKWWCMRTEDPLNGLKEAYLWMQVVCDATPVPNPDISLNYLKLGFQRVVFSSTCADEIQVCQHCESNYKQHCALTCGQCRSENDIGLCTFEEQFRGQWMDSGQNGDFLMNVETYTIRGSNMGTYNCLMVDHDLEEYKDKKFLLETYDNGCLPRYACAEMSKVNSSVMQFRLGDRHVWPLPTPTLKLGPHAQVESQKEYICKANNFQIHYRAESKYIKERPPRLIVNTEDIRELPCGIPPEYQNGIAFEEDGRRCGGCLYYHPTNNLKRFVIRPENCIDNTTTTTPGPAQFQSLPISYSCMASFSFHPGTFSIITKTTSFNTGLGQYLMWTFTKNKQIKVMKASEAFVYQHNEHPKSEYIQAQFSILQYDKYKCRMNVLYSTENTTTTTTTKINEHWIDHRPRTTPISKPGGNGLDKKYQFPDPNDASGKPGVDKSNVTPYQSKSGNLRGGDEGGSSSVFHCNESVYLILFLASLVTFISCRKELSIT